MVWYKDVVWLVEGCGEVKESRRRAVVILVVYLWGCDWSEDCGFGCRVVIFVY